MRIIPIFCAQVLTAAVALGQGSVWLSNWRPTQVDRVDTPFFDDRGVRLEGPNYLAQLYAWKKGEGFLPVGCATPFRTNGYFEETFVIIPFIGYEGPAWVQVRAWRVDGGPTFEQAALAGAWSGASGTLYLPMTGTPLAGCDPAAPSFDSEAEFLTEAARPLGPPTIPALLIGLVYPGPPIVVRQPEDQTVRARETATLSVIASSGVVASYQWHQQPSDRPDGLIKGATNAFYTTMPLFTNTTFWVNISNSAGSTLSERATVTVVGSGFPWLEVRWDLGKPLLFLEGIRGKFHQVEYSTDLGAATWTPLFGVKLKSERYSSYDFTATNSPMRFYRAVVLP